MWCKFLFSGSYQEKLYLDWSQTVSEKSQYNLAQPLIRRDAQTKLITVNFDPQVRAAAPRLSCPPGHVPKLWGTPGGFSVLCGAPPIGVTRLYIDLLCLNTSTAVWAEQILVQGSGRKFLRSQRCDWCQHIHSILVGTGVESDGTSSTDTHSCCAYLEPELLKGCEKPREGLFCDSRNLMAPEGIESVALRPWYYF